MNLRSQLVGITAGACLGAAAASEPARIEPARAPFAPDTGSLAIRCGTLIDGLSAEIREDVTVVVRNGRIASVAPATTPSAELPLLDLSGYTCLPGLIDLHTHLTDRPEDTADLRVYYTRTAAQTAAQGAENAEATLLAGFTTVRNVGVYAEWTDRALRDAINRGEVAGPRMQICGYYLTVAGGGGDLLVPDVDPATVPARFRAGVARGADAFRAKAQSAVAGGADVLKVIASGAVLAYGGVPGAPEMTEAEIAAVVQVAHAAGIKVAAHAHGAESIGQAIRAGADTIEHASLIDAEGIALARDRDVALSMDIYNGDYIDTEGRRQRWPEEFLRKNVETTEAQRQGFTRALAAGVPIAFGSDAGVFPHGLQARQFPIMVARGMTPMQAIQSATAVAARYLGWTDRVGAIVPGRYGDLIAVRGDPLADIARLQDIAVVVRGGLVFKPPGNGGSGRRAMMRRRMPIRFCILGLLFVLSFVNYLLRNGISVALPNLRADFDFSNTELGWILGSFNVAYALFQIPAGIYGEALGPRRALAIAAVTWGVLSAATGFVPSLFAASATGAMVSFMVVRFLMGMANAPMFPVAAAAFGNWFPVGSWAFPNAILSAGLTLGQAALGPFVTLLIVAFGWREAFYLLAPFGFLAGAWWWWYGRDTPALHASVTPEERALIDAGRPARNPADAAPGSWRTVLLDRDVLLLALSYFCMNYVFYIFAQWLFTYLVEERGFTLLESGVLYALPFVVGAVLATAGGIACDVLCHRLGPRWGCRLPAILGLVLVAGFLLAGAGATNSYLAVALLSLCFGFTQFTEGAFWQASTFVAGPHTATATGVLNTGGNLAGLLAPVVGVLLDRYGWWPTLASGSVFALVGAGLWLLIRVQTPNTAPD